MTATHDDVATTRLDAGAEGCELGLAHRVRRAVRALPAGAVLLCRSTAPAAEVEVPALVRLLGHIVRDVTVEADGVVRVTVEVR